MIGCAPAAAARCTECEDLRKECSVALGEYIRILAERNAARKRRDHDLVEAFEDIENEALEKCQNARQAISDHETTHEMERVLTDRALMAHASKTDTVVAIPMPAVQ